jgi:hypothetical protein
MRERKQLVVTIQLDGFASPVDCDFDSFLSMRVEVLVQNHGIVQAHVELVPFVWESVSINTESVILDDLLTDESKAFCNDGFNARS